MSRAKTVTKKEIKKVESLDGFQSDPFLAGLVIIAVVLISLIIRWLRTGRRLNSDGYVRKIAFSGKEQLEHRAIAEHFLSRRLKHWEVVHHINGRRADNRPENLCVMDRLEHERYHKWYDWVRKNYGKFPRRETQLEKLTGTFRGQLLVEPKRRRRKTS